MCSRSTRSRRLAGIAALCLLLLATSNVAAAERPNVVIIGIDTLRADHLGCYGYPRPTSPRIDALSREGVLFAHAIAQAPWTLPSFASMFTGLLPSNHGAGEGLQLDDALFVFTTPVPPLSPNHRTLATILQEAGYATGSFVSNGFVGSAVGLRQGFTDGAELPNAAAAVTLAVDWLQLRETDPFFLFVHIVDPHAPFEPSPEDAAPFLDPAYKGPIGASYNGRANPAWQDADRRRILDLYDGEVHYADRLAGTILDTLRERGYLEKTLVILVSDHGEELIERGVLGHGHTLYDELLHVPLVIRFPQSAHVRRVEPQVRAMDIFPTVLDVVGLPVPEGIDAVSLMPLVRGEPQRPGTEVAIAEEVLIKPARRAVRRLENKLIVEEATGAPLFFDLRADPNERANVAKQHLVEVERARAQLVQTLLAGAAGFRRQEGYHVLVRGEKKPHTVRMKLLSAGGIAGPVLFEPEADDRAQVAPDGKSLDLEFALSADEPDRDGVRFSVAGGGDLTIDSITVDGAPLPADRMYLGRRPAGTGPMGKTVVDESAIREPFATLPPAAQGGGVSVRLQSVKPATAAAAPIDAKTRENLRALGYME